MQTQRAPSARERELWEQHEEGDADATVVLAQYLLTGLEDVRPNHEEGIYLLRRLAANPFRPPHAVAAAKYVLGEAYRLGVGVARDPAQAVSWYVAAHQAGLMTGCHYVGWWFTGLMPDWAAPQPDLNVATRYFDAGAQEGCAECAAGLAMLHLEDMIPNASADTGCRWLRVAAKGGHPVAEHALLGHGRCSEQLLCGDARPSSRDDVAAHA